MQVVLGRFAAPFGESPGRGPQRRLESVAAGNESLGDFGVRNSEWKEMNEELRRIGLWRGLLRRGFVAAFARKGRGATVLGRWCSADASIGRYGG